MNIQKKKKKLAKVHTGSFQRPPTLPNSSPRKRANNQAKSGKAPGSDEISSSEVLKILYHKICVSGISAEEITTPKFFIIIVRLISCLMC